MFAVQLAAIGAMAMFLLLFNEEGRPTKGKKIGCKYTSLLKKIQRKDTATSLPEGLVIELLGQTTT
jgi:hypothetical protein